MKLLCLIPNFGTHQNHFLEKIIDEYSTFTKIHVDIVLFTTEDFSYSGSVYVTTLKYDPIIGVALSSEPRRYAFDNINKYDLYMHQENDTLITEDNILAFIEGQKQLDLESSNSYIHGFVRYEHINDTTYLIDMHKADVHSIGKIINDKLEVDNVHQGGWLVNNDQLEYLKNIDIQYGMHLEDSCSNFYYSPKWPGSLKGIPKYIYRNLITRSIIHHMPNKYANLDSNFLTLDELLQ